MEFSFLTSDQALSLWGGSTDSKTQDHQRTKTREDQIVRTHAKETTVIQDLASPATSSTLSSMPLPNNKQNKNTKQTGLPPHSALPLRGETNKKSAQISPCRKLTQTTGPTLGGQKPKGRQNSALEPGKGRSQTQ